MHEYNSRVHKYIIYISIHLYKHISFKSNKLFGKLQNNKIHVNLIISAFHVNKLHNHIRVIATVRAWVHGRYILIEVSPHHDRR